MKTLAFCFALIVMSCTLAFGQAYKVLYNFTGADGDGIGPLGRLSMDKAGNLYGVTRYGGNFNVGTAFELSPNSDGTWAESVIYSFCSNIIDNSCADGYYPMAALATDSAGNLYGTTSDGGLSNCPNSSGCGTVFELSPPSLPGGPWAETTIYSFCQNFSNQICIDGMSPLASLTLDASGNLYGTAAYGGAGKGGIVFELSRSLSGWTETLVHSFCESGNPPACPDGESPQAGVTFDAQGNLYGTTQRGGSTRKYAGGTVYKLSPGANGWTETVLIAFYSPYTKGALPLANVSLDKAGNLYSTASQGGVSNSGSVFRLGSKGTFGAFVFNIRNGANPMSEVLVDFNNSLIYGTASAEGANQGGNVFKLDSKGNQTVLYSFCQLTNCMDGGGPKGGVIANSQGTLFGTAVGGGTSGDGVVFEITP